MAKLDVYNWGSKKVGTVEGDSAVFEAEVKMNRIYDIVRWQLAGRRQGTHAAKGRGEVSGGGAKPFKQKGTGNARQGSIRSPLMESGGVHFAKKPRDFSFSMNKKYKRSALRSALSQLNKEGQIYVVKDMESAEGKTKELYSRLKNMGLKKALLVDEKTNDKFERAARNIPGVRYCETAGVNVYDLLRYKAIVVTEKALKSLEKRCEAGK